MAPVKDGSATCQPNGPGAIRFYEARSHRSLTAIEDMFGEGDTEYLYMMELRRKPRP
jgi:hypothetical protein